MEGTGSAVDEGIGAVVPVAVGSGYGQGPAGDDFLTSWNGRYSRHRIGIGTGNRAARVGRGRRRVSSRGGGIGLATRGRAGRRSAPRLEGSSRVQDEPSEFTRSLRRIASTGSDRSSGPVGGDDAGVYGSGGIDAAGGVGERRGGPPDTSTSRAGAGPAAGVSGRIRDQHGGGFLFSGVPAAFRRGGVRVRLRDG